MLQSMIGAVCGGVVNGISDVLEGKFKHVWADHANMISIRYTGVGALKTEFTRSGKRSGVGVAQDAIKSVQRLAQVRSENFHLSYPSSFLCSIIFTTRISKFSLNFFLDSKQAFKDPLLIALFRGFFMLRVSLWIMPGLLKSGFVLQAVICLFWKLDKMDLFESIRRRICWRFLFACFV